MLGQWALKSFQECKMMWLIQSCCLLLALLSDSSPPVLADYPKSSALAPKGPGYPCSCPSSGTSSGTHWLIVVGNGAQIWPRLVVIGGCIDSVIHWHPISPSTLLSTVWQTLQITNLIAWQVPSTLPCYVVVPGYQHLDCHIKLPYFTGHQLKTNLHTILLFVPGYQHLHCYTAISDYHSYFTGHQLKTQLQQCYSW